MAEMIISIFFSDLGLERSKALTRDFVAFGHNRYTKLKQSIKDYSIPCNIKI
jgi:hypothetical protein